MSAAPNEADTAISISSQASSVGLQKQMVPRWRQKVSFIANQQLVARALQVPYFVQLFRLNTAIASRVQASARLASFTVLATLTFVMVLATPADALISRQACACWCLHCGVLSASTAQWFLTLHVVFLRPMAIFHARNPFL